MDVFEYPAPNIKWHDGAQGLVNENPGGVVTPKAVTAPVTTTANKGGTLKVKIHSATDLAIPDTGGAHCYCTSAFYYNEAMDVVERRRTEPQKSSSSSSRPGFEECVFQKQIRIPYNSRQQFVQVAIYLVDAEGGTSVGGGSVRPFVGEAHVPIADPRSESLTSWPLMHGGAVGEQTGNLTVQLCLPGTEDDEEDDPAAAFGGRGSMPLSAARAELSAARAARAVGSMPLSVDAAGSVPLAAATGSREPLQAPPFRPPPAPLPSPIDVGDTVEIFSKSAGQWQIGRVTKVNGSELTVEYNARQRVVNLNAPDLHEYFRRAEGGGGAAPSEPKRTYAVGDAVEVFSTSAGKWLQGRVASLSGDEMTVQYGERMRKVNLRTDDHRTFLRRPELPQNPLAAAEATGQQHKIGDPVEIFSKSANTWVRGSVIKVDGWVITVEYGDRQRVVDTQAVNVPDILRRVEPESAPIRRVSAPIPPSDTEPCTAPQAPAAGRDTQMTAFPGLGAQPSGTAGAAAVATPPMPLPTGTAQFGAPAPAAQFGTQPPTITAQFGTQPAPAAQFGMPQAAPGQSGTPPAYNVRSPVVAQGQAPGGTANGQLQMPALQAAQLPGGTAAGQPQVPMSPHFGTLAQQGYTAQRQPAFQQSQGVGAYRYK